MPDQESSSRAFEAMRREFFSRLAGAKQLQEEIRQILSQDKTKTCGNPHHEKPAPATYVLTSDHLEPSFLCDACAWVMDHLAGDLNLQELAEWEEAQLSPEERRRQDREEDRDREYHRLKDDGLL
jgi:hypothetical protein